MKTTSGLRSSSKDDSLRDLVQNDSMSMFAMFKITLTRSWILVKNSSFLMYGMIRGLQKR